MNYFLSGALGGRPLPGIFFKYSNADSSYMASGETGSMPALKRACLMAKRSFPSSSAISRIVKNAFPLIFISLFSAVLDKMLYFMTFTTYLFSGIEKYFQKLLYCATFGIDNICYTV